VYVYVYTFHRYEKSRFREFWQAKRHDFRVIGEAIRLFWLEVPALFQAAIAIFIVISDNRIFTWVR